MNFFFPEDAAFTKQTLGLQYRNITQTAAILAHNVTSATDSRGHCLDLRSGIHGLPQDATIQRFAPSVCYMPHFWTPNPRFIAVVGSVMDLQLSNMLHFQDLCLLSANGNILVYIQQLKTCTDLILLAAEGLFHFYLVKIL